MIPRRPAVASDAVYLGDPRHSDGASRDTPECGQGLQSTTEGRHGSVCGVSAVAPGELSAAADNKLYLDYIAGSDSGAAVGDARSRVRDAWSRVRDAWSRVARFYTHPPSAFEAAFAARRDFDYPRQTVSRLLTEYNQRLGAHPRALAHTEAFAQPDTFCVITGQQAGLLGGPAYTAYKICTTIRLAAHLSEGLGVRVAPVFWLASEDHDFQEINHAYVVKRDGEVGRVKFRWREEGRPIVDLPISAEVKRAYETYWERVVPSRHSAQVREAFAYHEGEDWGAWQARVWSSLFSAHGLIVVEPHIIRAAAPTFFSFALESAQEIRRRLGDVAQELRSAGYAPALTSEQAGLLYTFDATGQRVRVQDPRAHAADAASKPERYSTDAALRPLLADATLPVVTSVLGPGEIAYQAMLKPLYELFEIPQPLLYPRQSYTIVTGGEAERLSAYQTCPRAVLTESLDPDVVLGNLVPEPERELFALAHRGIEDALSSLRSYVKGIDAGLERTWEQTVYYATHTLTKLEDRAIKARTRQLGFSKGELRRLQNALLPRGRLQERVLPLPHFLNRHGLGFIDCVLAVGELGDFRHHVVTLCDERGDVDA